MKFTEFMKSVELQDPRVAGYSDSVALEAGEQLVTPRGPKWDKRVMEAAKLIADVKNGRLRHGDLKLREAMTTSDFPLLFGDLLYRQMLGNYTAWPTTHEQWMDIVEVKDFRNLNLYTLDGGQGQLSAVGQRAPYPEIAFTEGRYQIAVAKYGQRYGISFEMVVNDDLNAFNRRPALMASAARRSESYLAVTKIADANGPHATYFTAGHSNIVTGNPSLSIQGLQTAMQKLAAQRDVDNQPIMISAYILLVPPALRVTAQNIMNATQLRINSDRNNNASGGAQGGATIDQYLYTANWMSGECKLVVEPYLPYVSATANGDTSWYLIAKPSADSRPAFVFAYLRGKRTPQLFMKSPNSMLLGGGDADPMDGDFDTDGIDYKIRHIFGAVQADTKMAVASNGTGIA